MSPRTRAAVQLTVDGRQVTAREGETVLDVARREGIDIPADDNVVAKYPIAQLAGAPNGDGAKSFKEFVLSGEGQQILTGYGFGTP